jgi:uncharacterized protein
LEALLRRMAPWSEFVLVTGLAFGPFIASSLRVALGAPTSGAFSAAALQYLLVYEVAMLALIGLILAARGRTLAWITPRPSWRDPAYAAALALTAYLSYWLAWQLAAHLVDMQGAAQRAVKIFHNQADWATIVLQSLVNGFFEEALVAGYVISFLKEKRGFWFAVNVSAGIRLSYHLYQGPIGVAGLVPLGLIFGAWYAKTGRLWPLVIAHVAMDIVGLAHYR